MLPRMTTSALLNFVVALLSRRQIAGLGLLWLGCTLAALPVRAAETNPAKPAPISVILDTDIGDDIDDTWALVLLLKSPVLDLKLVVGDYGESQYRARLLAKLLERA